jgi:hypothetical protein
MRVLLSVGCNDYFHATKLIGAVRDAESVFSALVGDQEHQYDSANSKLLISPSAEDFRKTLSDILYSKPEVTVFTLFFAGHAAAFDETLYLALKDALPDRIPATAIGFPEVLRTTAAARPKQANFILDACNAGALGFDIGSILKRTIIGNSETIGISFVAAAAAEQFAGEAENGGYFTSEFTKIIRGNTLVQRTKPFLNLAEIAQQIQTVSTLEDQNISYWTLNLQGPNLFAKNPHFLGSAHVTDTIVSQLNQRKIIGSLGGDFKSSIAKITTGLQEKTFSKTLENVFLDIEPEQRFSLIYGLAEGLRVELASSDDPFLEARVLSVLIGKILGLCPPADRNSGTGEIIEWFTSANRRALLKLKEALAFDRNALLISTISDLYELPIRISDIFGQCALFYFSQENISIADLDLIRSVTAAILGRYGNAVLALTDDQATGYLLFLEMCRRNRWTEFSEEVSGRLYYDLHKNFARCGAYSLNAEKRFALLAQRYRDSLSITRDLYNLPSDLTTVILSFSALGHLDEAIDFSLIEIDHTSINYFVPDRFTQFGLTGGLEGSNYTLVLGRDFFRCIDLRRTLRGEILPRFYSSASTMSWEDNFCSLASALALRDRLPWQIVDASKVPTNSPV